GLWHDMDLLAASVISMGAAGVGRYGGGASKRPPAPGAARCLYGAAVRLLVVERIVHTRFLYLFRQYSMDLSAPLAGRIQCSCRHSGGRGDGSISGVAQQTAVGGCA